MAYRDDDINDFKAIRAYAKAIREERKENFEQKWLPELEKLYNIMEGEDKYIILDTSFGAIDYFPKANRVLIRKKNKWISSGLKWIITNLLNK